MYKVLFIYFKQEGIPAEITALAQGYNNIADILNRLKNVSINPFIIRIRLSVLNIELIETLSNIR